MELDFSGTFESLLYELSLLENGKDLVYTDDVANLVTSIKQQKEAMDKQGFEPEFVLMNKRNYERLLTYVHHYAKDSANADGLVDAIWGMRIVVWDVPIDYVNVRGKASTEFAYDEGTIRGGN